MKNIKEKGGGGGGRNPSCWGGIEEVRCGSKQEGKSAQPAGFRVGHDPSCLLPAQPGGK